MHRDQPSRRMVAKGAAWAVPAVAVAATAPSLAASTEACGTGVLQVSVSNCATGLLSSMPYFVIQNPVDSGCEVPSGTEFTVALSSGDSLIVDEVNELNDFEFFELVGVRPGPAPTLTFRTTMATPLGGFMTVQVYARHVVASLPEGGSDGAQATLTILGSSDSFTWEATGLAEDVYLECT